MVQYDYSSEPNNPWDRASWSPHAQIDFVRRTREKYKYIGHAEDRIKQRIAQSDTKGVPPRAEKKTPPFQVIVQNRYLLPPSRPITLGFGMAGPVAGETQWTMPVITTRMTFPSPTRASEARCDTPPTDQVTLTLSTATNINLCTVTFAADETTGTFVWTYPAGLILNPGDLLYLFVNGSSDATFAGVNIAFVGQTVPS